MSAAVAKPVRLGDQSLPLPPLTAPVGAPQPPTRYPVMNAPADVALVDTQLQAIAELQSNPSPADVTALSNAGIAHPLALAHAVAGWRSDRPGAIAGFQALTGAADPTELSGKLITPGGKTWRALFTYGRMASGLETLKDSPKDPKDYIYSGGFDLAKFATELSTRIPAAARGIASRYNAQAVPDAQRLLSLMAADPYIIDIRWMAYMLATAFWETTSPTTVSHPVLDKHGKPVLGADKKPRVRETHPWLMAMRPVDEVGHGAGRNYYLAVKVTKNADGSARVLEQDGDAFTVDTKGAYKADSAGARPGAPPKTVPDPDYAKDGGAEFAYFGRGYVQLTWWYNYATSGVAIEKGLDLLFDPELAKTPEIAYALMAFGMRTGRGFANGHMLQHYFYGAHTDYAGARAMVNSRDPHVEIVQAAELFEAALMACKT